MLATEGRGNYRFEACPERRFVERLLAKKKTAHNTLCNRQFKYYPSTII